MKVAFGLARGESSLFPYLAFNVLPNLKAVRADEEVTITTVDIMWVREGEAARYHAQS